MSHLLWKAYIEDNVDKFRRLLAPAGYNNAQAASKSPSLGAGGVESSDAFGTSPRAVTKTRKTHGFGAGFGGTARSGNATLGRSEVNSRDHAGLTILLRAASSTSENAVAFVRALLEHPSIDIYVQDPESGWNALHRALYAGNISIARFLLDKERRDLTGQTVGTSVSKAGRLIKTKDHEGNSPFDLYNATIGERHAKTPDDSGGPENGSEGEEVSFGPDVPIKTAGLLDLIDGDELFAFGSNKNLSLGLGDEDDRQYPERVYLQRPQHLLGRFYNEYLEKHGAKLSLSGSHDESEIPTLTRDRRLLIHDVVLSKLHSAIVTTDPVSNLYVCGVGRGGRLGLGDENTRFNYMPVQGGLTEKKVAQVALGQNHSMAITSNGELWTWGSNVHSQLGYVLPEPTNKGEEPMSTTPRQVFGPLKREAIVGIAASAIHSVAHTRTSLYCWGKNVGQLALMDADSRSLEIQQTPRRVAPSLFSSPIVMISAIDKATTCLLANHTVCVFTSYGYNMVKFPFAETIAKSHLGTISMSSRYDAERGQIKYITSGGETISAITGRGDLFTMHLTQKTDVNSSTSTTNPSKIRGAITQPQCIWTAHKDGVRSVGVGEHGSVIISTKSGAVWRRIKRAKAKDSYVAGSTDAKRSDFKFQRVPSITNIATVRSTVFGAFAAVRKDSEVMLEQIAIGDQTLWDDVAPLNPLRKFECSESSTKHKNRLKFWDADRLKSQLGAIAFAVLKSPDLEADLQAYLTDPDLQDNKLDTIVRTSISPHLQIPIHGWILSARSSVMRHALRQSRRKGRFDFPDFFSIDAAADKMIITFAGLDIVSVLNLVLYVYEDRVIPAWNFTRIDQSLAYRYRQIRTETVKLASKLEMSRLEAAAQKQLDPKRSLDEDLKSAVEDPLFFEDGDAILELEGSEQAIHSALLCRRCPFFEGLFHGRSGGMWLASRVEALDSDEKIKIDLKHIERKVFDFVLRYLYADVGEELFDDLVCENLDDFTDLVLDVMAVADELMLDRLSQICQKTVGRFVTTRNVAHFLNVISPYAVSGFKDAGLEYICLQMETFLENHLLDDLEEDLLLELDGVVRDNQLCRYPFARSGRAELLLYEKYAELAQDIDEERHRRVTEMAFKAAQKEEERKFSSSFKARFGSLDDVSTISPIADRSRTKAKAGHNEPFSPDLRPRASHADLIFDMEEDEALINSPSIRSRKPLRLNAEAELDQITPLADLHRDSSGKTAQGAQLSPEHLQMGSKKLDCEAASPFEATTFSSASTPQAGNPWGSTKLPTSKLGLREIMSEAGSNQSALSAGLAAHKGKPIADNVREAPAKLQQTTKISQKERKKQQQQQLVQATQAASTNLDRPAWDRPSIDRKPAPWTMVSHAQKHPLQDPPSRSSTTTGPANPKPLAVLETSAMSIPRRTQSPDTRFSGQSRTPNTSSSMRPAATPASALASASKPLVPHSKSYIKPAPKAEPTLGLSMADIIGQQKREQEIVKGAVAKRSLQEIQQEQAFQEWWDEESRRTQEEEARRLERESEREKERERESNGGGGKGRRGRGGKFRRAGGYGSGGRGGNGDAAAGNDAKAATHGGEGHAQSRGAGRSMGRGRGR